VIAISSGRLIKNVHVEDAASKLSKEEYGIHCMVIYPDLTTLREFYSYYIKKQIEENNEVVLFTPFYETTDSVRQILSEGHTAIEDVSTYENENFLIITDALKKYFKKDEGDETDWSFKERMVKHAKKKGKRGFSILGDMGAFNYKGKINELVDYELSLPSKYDIDMKGFCLYHQKDFDRFEDEQKQRVVEHHGIAMRIETQ
jgi:hypothetical protein